MNKDKTTREFAEERAKIIIQGSETIVKKAVKTGFIEGYLDAIEQTEVKQLIEENERLQKDRDDLAHHTRQLIEKIQQHEKTISQQSTRLKEMHEAIRLSLLDPQEINQSANDRYSNGERVIAFEAGALWVKFNVMKSLNQALKNFEEGEV